MNEGVSQEEIPTRKSVRREEPEVVKSPQVKSTIQSEDRFQYY